MQRNPDDSECISKETIVAVRNKTPPSLYLSSLHSDHLLLHHHQSLFQEHPKTRSTSMRGLRTPLSRYWMARNCLLARKVTRNSPSGAGWTPRLSTTGRGGSTGTWQDGARTVAQSATGHAGAGKASRTTLRQGFGTWTNRGRFELVGGQCYELHRFSGPIFFFHVFYLCFTHYFHCFTFIVSL